MITIPKHKPRAACATLFSLQQIHQAMGKMKLRIQTGEALANFIGAYTNGGPSPLLLFTPALQFFIPPIFNPLLPCCSPKKPLCKSSSCSVGRPVIPFSPPGEAPPDAALAPALGSLESGSENRLVGGTRVLDLVGGDLELPSSAADGSRVLLFFGDALALAGDLPAALAPAFAGDAPTPLASAGGFRASTATLRLLATR